MERKLAFYYFVVLFFASNLCQEPAEVETSDEPNVSTNLEEAPPEDPGLAPIEPSLSDTYTDKADSNNKENVLEINCTSVDSSVLVQPDDPQLEISTIVPTEPLEIQPDLSTSELDVPEGFPTPVETTEAEGSPDEAKEIMETASDVISANDSIAPEKVELNISADSTEDIPSFSEWAQKRLEEVGKNEQINSSLKGPPANGKAPKLRWKNYASLDCGAKVVAANPESVSPGSVLSPSTDEYKLNKCTNRIWFVVELCEAIQIKKIDLANYELFSSSPKDFTVSVSDRYPTRDWSFVGKFVAKDERTIQGFELDTHLFGKYVKIEVKSHYGSEHYCPISLFRAFGTSVFEVLQKEDPAHKNHPDDDDDDGDDEDAFVPPGDPQKNIFNSATDAVISMVKRAAQVLGNKVNNGTGDCDNSTSLQSKCFTPRHLVVCNDCNSTLFGDVYELMSCRRGLIGWLVKVGVIYDALLRSDACRKYKLNVEEGERDETSYFRNVSMMLPEKFVGAMCNELVVEWNQADLNLTQQYLNVTKKLSNEKIVNLEVEKESVGKLNETIVESLDSEEPTIDADNPDVPIKFDIELEENSNQEESVEVPSVPTIEDNSTEIATESLPVVTNVTVEVIETLEEEVVANSPQPPKESIFIRLSSRIRDLETNMSLSSQYLEELSKRYKKQIEDAQHMYEKTIQTFKEDSMRRDEAMRLLEERLYNLTDSVETLLTERQFFYSIIYLTLPISLVYLLVRFFCVRSAPAAPAPARRAVKILRRRSVDVLTRQRRQQQQRRLSDQTVKYDEKNKRPTKRKRKKAVTARCEDWVTDEGRIEDCPFALEENDLCALEGLPLVGDEDREEGKNVAVVVDLPQNSNSVERVDKAVVVGNGVGGAKKEKRGFKRLLKKVF